jgi:hypothetical protein
VKERGSSECRLESIRVSKWSTRQAEDFGEVEVRDRFRGSGCSGGMKDVGGVIRVDRVGRP